MIKLLALLTLVTVVWTLYTVRNEASPLISGSIEVAPRIVDTRVVTQETLGIETSASDSSKTYINEKLGYSLDLPAGIQTKLAPNGTLTLSRDALVITISQFRIGDKDTVNTIAEQDINSKVEKLGDKFRLLESISPIAIGNQTGIAYSSEEDGKDLTYFYIPQGFKYLMITNLTEDSQNPELISLSDDIIYSIEIIED